MKEQIIQPKRKSLFKKYLLWITGGLFFVIVITGIILYYNFNRLLSDALMKSFNQSIISDVYELKFTNLNVSITQGNIKVKNMEIFPREKQLQEYPDINSSFRLTTKKLQLTHVDIPALLKKNVLKLEKIEIDKPEVELVIADEIPVFLPFRDSSSVTVADNQNTKKAIEGFLLQEFKLTDASFRVANSARHRDLSVNGVNITLKNLMIDQQPGKDIITYSYIGLNIDEITGSLKKDKLRYIGLKDFQLNFDSLKIVKTPDTLIYHFDDYNLGLKDLDVQTEDSLFHLALQSIQLSYSVKSIKLNHLAFKPNISKEEMQKRYKFQNTQFEGEVGALNITGIDFDSLMYRRKLIVEEISLDSVLASVFKDKTKPFDTGKFPEYFGQTVKKFGLPLNIKKLTAANASIVYNERKPDSLYATVNVKHGNVEVNNITNFPSEEVLKMKALASLGDKVYFSLILGFSYNLPQFSFEGSFKQFNFADLNDVIEAFVPAKISKGVVDKIEFSGIAKNNGSSGKMEFLYHDLDVELQLEDKAKWKNSVLSFAANTVVASSNPESKNRPPKIVKFHTERDMNKGFINVILKSVLTGLKETVLMSKENKKNYREEKKKARKERRE